MSDAVHGSRSEQCSHLAHRLVELGAQAIFKRGHPFQQKRNSEQVDLWDY